MSIIRGSRSPAGSTRWRLATVLLIVVAALVTLAVAIAPSEESVGDRSRPCPRGAPDAFDADHVVGMRTHRARRIARLHDCTLRPVKRNGEWLIVTDDLRRNRINVVIVDRRVKRVHGVY